MAGENSNGTGPYDASALDGPSIREKRDIPDGLWMRCDGCEEMLYRKAVAENAEVCPECGYHFRMGGRARVNHLVDPDTFEERFADIAPSDPLGFQWRGQTMVDRIKIEQAKTGNT